MSAERVVGTQDERATAAPLVRASRRAIIIGLLLVPLNAYWLVVIELVRNTQTPTSVSLFFNAVFTVLCVALLNAPLKRLAPKAALQPGELTTIYILVTLGSAMAGIDMLCCLIPIMGYAGQYATVENRWGELVVPGLPHDLMVFDPTSLDRLWTGGSSLLAPESYGPWIWPLIRWNVFIAVLCMAFLGLTTIFRRRWIESERLSYPVAQLPLAMTQTPRRLISNQWFWLAFGLACTIDLLNGLHVLRPAVPSIPVRSTASPSFNLAAQLIDRPWNAANPLFVSFYPFVIGMGLLIPSELSFSCWVFYLLFKLQIVLASQSGKLQADAFPYTKEQSFGSFVGLVLFSVWVSRHHLMRVAAAAWRGAQDAAEREPMRYRTAIVVIALAFTYVVVFGVHAGMALWYALAFFVIYFTLVQAVTRIRAEMGIPTHELYFVGPGQILARLAGTRRLGSGNLIVSYVFYWFNRAYRSHPMPHIAEGHFLAHRAGLAPRSLTVPMLLAMVLGAACACVAILHLYFRDGGGAKWGPFYHGHWIAIAPLQELVAKIQTPTSASATVVAAVITGCVITFAGMVGNSQLAWWPLHPIGYAVANAWAMDHMWFSVLIAWCLKATITRYGGQMAFRHAAPFAMGLILGDFTSGSLWSLYGTWKGATAYSIWV